MSFSLQRFLLSSFLAFFAGNTINFSIVLYSQEVLDSALLSGVGYALVFGPSLVLGWLAGTFCDRGKASRIIYLFQTGVVSIVLILSFVTFWSPVTVQPILIALISLYIGVSWSFLGPARFTMVSRITDKELAKKSTSLMSAFVMTAMGLAPVVVTYISYNFGWISVFAFIIFLLVTSLALLIGIAEHVPERNALKVAWYKDVQTVIRYLSKTKPNIYVFYLIGFFTFLILGSIQILVPLHASESLGLVGVQKGMVISTTAVGLVTGNFLALKLIDFITLKWLMLLPLMSFIFFLALSVSHYFELSVAIVFLSSLVIGLATNLAITRVQGHSGEEFKGRIIALYTVCTQVGPAVGALMASWFVSVVGQESAVLAIVALSIIGLSGCYALLICKIDSAKFSL